LSEATQRQWATQQAKRVETLRSLGPPGVLPGLPVAPKSLAEAVPARGALERLEFSALVNRLDAARTRRLTELAASPAETTPSCALLRRMQPLLTAAKWDWNVGRCDRAIERLAWADRLRQQADELARAAPRSRLAAAIKPGPIVPYVTIAGNANRAMAELGLTVSHDWLPWAGGLDPATEEKPGEYDWSRIDRMIAAINDSGMTSIPLINFDPPKWFTEQYKGFGDQELVDPKILGYEPEALRTFGRWINAAAQRVERADQILCWSVRNEPAYLPGGPVRSPLMLEAMRKWLARKYGEIGRLNEVWQTSYTGFDQVPSPQARDKEPAAWYDMAMFKAEAIAGELGWEADIIQKTSRVKRTGAKYVPTILDASGVRGGMGPDPWTGSAPQRGVALCDLYTDSDWQTYRLASESWFGAGGSPVISAETGLASRPRERRHRWIRYPDERQRSFAWSGLQFGLFGVQYWTWSGSEEYAFLNWDGTVPDDAIWTAMANQERLAAAGVLSTLQPVTHVGLYYPQATFIDSAEAEDLPHQYSQLFNTLSDLGYQLRNFSFRDMDRALKEVEAVILPPAPYVEAEIVPKLREFVRGGGKLLAVTVPAIYDEHLRPLNGGQSALADVIGEGQAVRGRTTLIEQPVGLSFGRGMPVVDLATKWRFKFGLSWPQQGMTVTSPPTAAEDAGVAQHWEAPEYDDSSWPEIAVPGVWETNGYPDLDGYGWYRLTFDVPAKMKGRRILLTGDTLDDRAWIYVNGKLVRETQTWDEAFQEDVTRHLRPGARNVIALRILDNCFQGGVRGRLTLTSPDIPSEDRALLDRSLRSLGVEPEAACSAAGIVRRLMVDAAGQRQLLYTNETGNSLDAEITVPVALQPAQGEVMNLLEGQRFQYRSDKGRTVVRLKLGPHDIGILPLRSVGERR
jgi:hypothetical protein